MQGSILNQILGKLGFQILTSGSKIEAVSLKKIKTLRLVFGYYSFLLLAWGLYRFLFRLPEEIEEVVLKPLIWLGSVFWVTKKIEKKSITSLGLSKDGLLKSIGLGVGLGMIFFLEGTLFSLVKEGQLKFSGLSFGGLNLVRAFLVASLTALSEEIVFRGFIFNRLWRVWEKEWGANITTSLLFVLIHIPITIFVYQYNPFQIVFHGLVVFAYSLGAGFVFARTKIVLTPILLNIFWSWPILTSRGG